MNSLSMKCPKCGQSDLVTTDRSEIEIDVCPSCRGVWLDRGELDKLIERSIGARGMGTSGREWDHDSDDEDGHRRRDHSNHDSLDDHGRPRRRHSWLSELFD